MVMSPLLITARCESPLKKAVAADTHSQLPAEFKKSILDPPPIILQLAMQTDGLPALCWQAAAFGQGRVLRRCLRAGPPAAGRGRQPRAVPTPQERAAAGDA